MQLESLGYWSSFDVEPLSVSPTQASYVFKYRKDAQATYSSIALDVPTKISDWLSLRIKPYDAPSWTGRFEPGVEGISGLYATPSERCLCVVVKGQGYWVPVEEPATFEIIPAFPIKNVLAIPKAGIIVFVDYVRLCAYGPNGLLWKTCSLSWDGLKLKSIDDKSIRGTGWDASIQAEVPFLVEIGDGKTTGGASPETYSRRDIGSSDN